MNELKSSIKVEEMIYEIRGVQVMLDSDLAKLYQCKNGTKDINKAVKRNINRFPNDFYFQLTKKECDNLWFQIGTANNMSRSLPHVFTEEGVAMLASVLHTEVAEQTSVNIMRAFVKMKKYFSNQLNVINIVNYKLLEHDKRLSIVENTLDKLNEKQKINTIFYKGQIFDAYVFFMEILKKAKREIIIIDNYVGIELLKIIKEIKIPIKMYTSNINEEDIKKYKKQYNNVEIIYNEEFHDRFIILDKKEVYHSGASFKDLGTKCVTINKIEDNDIIYAIIKRINN